MVFWRPGLAHEIAFSSCYVLLAGVVAPLVTATVAGYYGNDIGSPLLPLLSALSACPGALGGGLGGCGSVTISSRCCIA
jgi:hypothetical protein